MDIAVFVNAQMRKLNRSVVEDHRIRRIDAHVMRLLCELPWPDNYRGLQGLLTDVFEERNRAGIQHPDLTFNMVVEGLRRLETLLAARNIPGLRHESARVMGGGGWH